MRITRSGRVIRETQRLANEPEAVDDRTDEDESVEMDSSLASSDPGSLAEFVVESDDESEGDDESYTEESEMDSESCVLLEFLQLLCQGARPEKTAKLLDMIEEGQVPDDLFVGALVSRVNDM